MAKVRAISVKDAEIPLWEKFIEICRREGVSGSEILMAFVKEYVDKHASGNPVSPLDKWVQDPGYTLFPTLGDKPNTQLLKKMPTHLLQKLMDNAESYMMEAKHQLLLRKEHSNHLVKVKTCPYCSDLD